MVGWRILPVIGQEGFFRESPLLMSNQPAVRLIINTINMKAKNIEKPLQRGQAGGIACRRKYGPEYYSNMAKKAHEKRKKLLASLKK